MLALGLVILLCFSWIWQLNGENEQVSFSQVEQLIRH